MWDCKHISPSISLSLCIVCACYFRFCLSKFLLWKVSLLAAFNSYYMYLNRIEYHGDTTAEYGTALCFLLPISQFSCFLLCNASKKLFLSFSRTFCDYQGGLFKIPGQVKDELHFFRIPGVFQDQGHFPGLFKVCVNPATSPQ